MNIKNPVEFQDVVKWQASGVGNGSTSQIDATTNGPSTCKSAVRFTNPLIFELEH